MILPNTHGLILTGGGARAAYQVGVLKAVSDLLPDLHDPFRIICGTSAGALNAVGLASGADIFRHNVARLEQIWANLKTGDVYRSDVLGMTRRLTHFARSVVQGQSEDVPMSLLNNDPLRALLEKHIPFDRIRQAILDNRIDAVAVTACGYACGQSISFFQARDGIEGWNLGQRVGIRCDLGLDHLMASSAIPTVFPPVKINREYFGDGVIRQMAHISPTLHMGADSIFIIGVSANRVCVPTRKKSQALPSLAQVMEHVLNGAFIDTMEYDVDRLLLINRLVELIPQRKLAEAGMGHLRPINMLEISPSQPIEEIASRHIDALPLMLRRLMGKNLDLGEGGNSLASYLLFDSAFCRELIALGYADAKQQARAIEQFFAPPPRQEQVLKA